MFFFDLECVGFQDIIFSNEIYSFHFNMKGNLKYFKKYSLKSIEWIKI